MNLTGWNHHEDSRRGRIILTNHSQPRHDARHYVDRPCMYAVHPPRTTSNRQGRLEHSNCQNGGEGQRIPQTQVEMGDKIEPG